MIFYRFDYMTSKDFSDFFDFDDFSDFSDDLFFLKRQSEKTLSSGCMMNFLKIESGIVIMS